MQQVAEDGWCLEILATHALSIELLYNINLSVWLAEETIYLAGNGDGLQRPVAKSSQYFSFLK